MPLALVLIVLAAGWRVTTGNVPALANFAPLMALTFCSAVYFRDKRLWLVPFAALIVYEVTAILFYRDTMRFGRKAATA